MRSIAACPPKAAENLSFMSRLRGGEHAGTSVWKIGIDSTPYTVSVHRSGWDGRIGALTNVGHEESVFLENWNRFPYAFRNFDEP